ncbi:MAG: MFS transporter [Propionicimonas sp.]
MSQFRSLVGTASVFLAIVVGTSVATVPTPVYPLIAAQLGLDPLGITVTFAVFALGAVLGLAIGATAAARLPRRRVYLISAAVQALAALILALDLGVAGFVAGRAATGIGAGLLAASGTALLLELAGGLPSRAQAALRLVAPAAAYLGLALGSGLPAAAQVATPTDLQWLFAGLAVAILALLTVSVSYRAPAAVEVPLGGSVPRSRLPWAAVLGPFAAFMTTGLFGSITAILLELLGLGSAGLSGVLAGAVFLAGAGGVVLIAPRLSLPAIGVLLATFLTAVALGVELGSLPLLLVASTAAGATSGALFASSLRLALSAAPAAAGFRQTSLVFAAAYSGLALPVIGLGLALRLLPTGIALWWFAGLAAVASLGAAWGAYRVTRHG